MKKLKKPIIYFSDFETTTKNSLDYQEEGHTNCYLWALQKQINKKYDFLISDLELKADNKKRKHELTEKDFEEIKNFQEKRKNWLNENVETIIGNSLDEYYDTLQNEAFKQERSIVVYFHNLSFDGDMLYKYLLRRGDLLFLQEQEKHLVENLNNINYFSLFKTNGNILNIEIHWVKYVNRKRVTRNVKFICSYMLTRQSIDNIGYSMGISKLLQFKDKLKNGWVNGIYYDGSNEAFYNIGGKNLKNYPDYYNVLVEYIKNDCTIINLLIQFINRKFKEEIPELLQYNKTIKGKDGNQIVKKENVKTHNFLTATSLAKKLAENAFYLAKNENYFVSKIDNPFYIEENYNIAQLAYRGGFTQFNKKYLLKEMNNIAAIDINSSYPNSLTKLLPINGKMLTEMDIIKKKKKNDKLQFLKWYIVDIKFNIKKEYQDTVAIIPKEKTYFDNLENYEWLQRRAIALTKFLNLDTKKQRYLFNGIGRYVVYSEEFEIWKKFYDIEILFQETFYLEADYLLKPFVDKFYKLKENAKTLAEKNLMKLLLNVIYGATAKREKFKSLFFSEEEYEKNEEIDFEKYDGNTDKKILHYVGTKKQRKIKTHDKELNCYELWDDKVVNKKPNKFIAAQCTSYSRIKLFEAMLKVGVDNFVYCDTDSIYLKNNQKTKEATVDYLKNLGLKIDKNKLGFWALEELYEKFIVRGAKNYIKNKEGKWSGTIAGTNKARAQDLLSEEGIYQLFLNEETFFVSNSSLNAFEDDWGIVLDWIDKKNKKGNN